jgi:RimJ/RimL family protein N-acetyltransferase
MTARAAQSATQRLAITKQVSVRRLQDRSVIRRLLETSRAYSAYAMAYLDARMFHLAQFFEAQRNDKRALIMHARGGLGPSTLLLGDTDLVATLLALHPGNRQTLLTCEPEHVDQALSSYNLWRPQSMMRMQVRPDAFQTPSGLPAVRRLIGADARDLNRLYAMEGDGIWYSGRQVGEGIYYGALNRGRLVAAAGTHIYSQHQGVAVVGNVFTHPDFRGHGYGTAVTAAVTAHLLRDCELVVLNVDPGNKVAQHVYERLGYHDTGRLVEAMSTRRHPYSPLPLLRRFVGRMRSGTPGLEVMEQ